MAALEKGLEDPVRNLLTAAACLVASATLASPPPAVLLENERVRVGSVSTAPAGAAVDAVLVTLKP